MQAVLKSKTFAFLNSIIFLGIVLGLIIWADQFFSDYSGYFLDFLALSLTLVLVHFGQKYLREFQSSHKLFLSLLIPFAIVAILAWYSIQNARLKVIVIHTRVVNSQTNGALHGAVVSCLSKQSLRWETDSFGQIHIELTNVSKEEPLIFYAYLKGFHPGNLEIKPSQIKREIILPESIKLSPDSSSQN